MAKRSRKTTSDESLALSAMVKKHAGDKPTARETEALNRVEKTREQVFRDRMFSHIPKGLWCEWSGLSNHKVNAHADTHGVPVRGRTINLPEFVAWVYRQQFATATGDEDMDGPSTPAIEAARHELLLQKIRIVKFDADEREGVTCPIEEVHEMFAIIAGMNRNLSEQLTKRFGVEAYEMMKDIIEQTQSVVDSTICENLEGEK